MFGRFHVQFGGQVLTGINAYRAQDLFCYLLLCRARPQPREALAGLLWSEVSTAQSRKYLRKALWHLQTVLDSQAGSLGYPVLLVDSDWVEINPQADLWIDVAMFEQVYDLVRGVSGEEMAPQTAEHLQRVIDLYRGDLLEGCYHDWCLYERERLQYLYLAMLDKLMAYYETCGEYEAGLTCGVVILRYDRARERTHRRLMRLHCLARDRTAALRQYERCVAALDEELGVGPARHTTELYERIRTDQFARPTPSSPSVTAHAGLDTLPSLLLEAIEHLKQIQGVLADAHHHVQESIQAVELTIDGRPQSPSPR
jgi:DNA-binding SARP family transcriptional activator